MITSSRGKERDIDRHRDRDRDRDRGKIKGTHPIVAATASVALWTVLHRSEQARALVRKEVDFGSALAMLLQDETKRGSGSGSWSGSGSGSGSGSTSQMWTGRDTNSGKERILYRTAIGAGLNHFESEDDKVETTTMHARTALLHLMEST